VKQLKQNSKTLIQILELMTRKTLLLWHNWTEHYPSL